MNLTQTILHGLIQNKHTHKQTIVGMVMPHRVRTGKLTRGQMGYIIAGLRNPREARPGSVLSLNRQIPTLIGNNMALPPSVSTGQHSVLFASVHPVEGSGFDELFNAVSKMALSDAGLEITQTAGSSSGSGGGPFLGPGLRVGFQGLLHVEVFRQRLEDEFNQEAIVTPPQGILDLICQTSSSIDFVSNFVPRLRLMSSIILPAYSIGDKIRTSTMGSNTLKR